MKIKINDVDQGQRLDRLLSETMNSVSRSKVAKVIRDGSVLVNGAKVLPSYKLKIGDEIILNEIDFREDEVELKAKNVDFEVIFENDDFAVINKPAGLTVHPGSGTRDLTLAHGLLARFDTLSLLAGRERPGIVHRLDKDTSGLLLIAKSDEAFTFFREALRLRQIEKHYFALVWGKPDRNTAIIDAPIGRNTSVRVKMAVREDGRESLTQYRVQKKFRDYSLLNIRLITGRTHQIRVHLQAIGHPVAGDSLYASRKQLIAMKAAGVGRLFLHAYKLKFEFKKEQYSFTSPLPEELSHILDKLTA